MVCQPLWSNNKQIFILPQVLPFSPSSASSSFASLPFHPILVFPVFFTTSSSASSSPFYSFVLFLLFLVLLWITPSSSLCLPSFVLLFLLPFSLVFLPASFSSSVSSSFSPPPLPSPGSASEQTHQATHWCDHSITPCLCPIFSLCCHLLEAWLPRRTRKFIGICQVWRQAECLVIPLGFCYGFVSMGCLTSFETDEHVECWS